VNVVVDTVWFDCSLYNTNNRQI